MIQLNTIYARPDHPEITRKTLDDARAIGDKNGSVLRMEQMALLFTLSITPTLACHGHLLARA